MVGSPAAGTACGLGGGVGLGIEAAFKLLAQLHTGGLLDMGVGVHQHIRTGVSCGPLHRLDVAAGDHQLVGGTGVTHPFGNPRETPINCAARPRPVR